MSPTEIAYPIQAQQYRDGPAPRERDEARSRPAGHGRAAATRADGTMPGLSARLGRLALAQRQHHQGWR